MYSKVLQITFTYYFFQNWEMPKFFIWGDKLNTNFSCGVENHLANNHLANNIPGFDICDLTL
jgi:hypothetical protein